MGMITLTDEQREALKHLVARGSTFPDHNGASGGVTRVDYSHLQTAASALSWLLSAGEPVVAQGWRCFHCDEVFDTEESARVHFGTSLVHEPGCQIDIAKYREMEARVERCDAEDSDVHREMYSMQTRHQQALRREEEKGYAAGLADGRSIGIVEGWKLVPMEPTDKMTFIGQSHRYESTWSIGAIYREMLAASPSAPDHIVDANEKVIAPAESVVLVGKNALVLTAAQLLEALDFIAPDRATDPEQMESEVAIEYGEGHSGKAMYCWCAEYPEEGSWLLGGTSVLATTQPAQTEPALTDRGLAPIAEYAQYYHGAKSLGLVPFTFEEYSSKCNSGDL